MNAEEFYRQRDDRTSRSVQSDRLAEATVCLSIDDEAAESRAGQICFLALANLLARWCRRVYVPPGQCPILCPCPVESTTLEEAAITLMRAADPYGHFEAGNTEDAIRIHVGSKPIASAFPVIGDGWLALSGRHVAEAEVEAERDDNPLGAAMAACLGCCHAMRRALGLDYDEGVKFSTYDLRADEDATKGPKLSPLRIGSVVVVGCGAVGASIAYLLPFLPIAIDRLVLIDGDIVEVSNLNRVPIFFFAHAHQRDLKTSAVAKYLRARGIGSEILPGRFRDAVGSGLKAREFDVLIPAANEEGVHADIQGQCPPLMIYGTTGPNWDVNLHRHIPLREDCLSCRFPSDRPAPPLGCSQGHLRVGPAEAPAVGVLPFLSLAAATLATAEVMKLSMSSFPLNKNYGVVQFGTPELRPMTFQKGPRGCLHCWDEAVWKRLGSERQFAHLS